MWRERGTSAHRQGARERIGWMRVGVVIACLTGMLGLGMADWVDPNRAQAFGVRQSRQGTSPSFTSSVGVTEPRYSAAQTTGGDRSLAPMLAPELTATSAIAVDLTTGQLLYEKDANQRIPPASTLKMVTALTVLRVMELDERVTITASDLVDTAVYSNAALQAGDEVTVRDLLAGLLIPSGGDAANALARTAGERLGPRDGQDPIDRFVEEMNDLSADLGMRNSRFENPDGRDVPGQYSSARDLALAAQELLGRRALANIVAEPVYEMTVEGPNARTYEVFNTNELIGIEQVHGVKTGTTDGAGENLVLATRREGNQVLTVVTGSEHRYEDTQALLDSIDEVVTWVRFGISSQFPEVEEAAEEHGFALSTPVVLPVRNEMLEQLSARVDLGQRPEGGSAASWGHVVFLQDDEAIYRIPVISDEP